MTGERFWEVVDRALEANQMSITELAAKIGKSRNMVYGQRSLHQLPKAAQIAEMAKVLKINLMDADLTVDEFQEYLPYLRKADPWQIAAVRKILEMPDVEETT